MTPNGPTKAAKAKFTRHRRSRVPIASRCSMIDIASGKMRVKVNYRAFEPMAIRPASIRHIEIDDMGPARPRPPGGVSDFLLDDLRSTYASPRLTFWSLRVRHYSLTELTTENRTRSCIFRRLPSQKHIDRVLAEASVEDMRGEGDVTLDVTGLEADLDLHTYNASGARIASSRASGTTPESLTLCVTSGVQYYIGVTPKSSQGLAYDPSVSYSTSTSSSSAMQPFQAMEEGSTI